MKPILYLFIGSLFFGVSGCRMKEKAPETFSQSLAEPTKDTVTTSSGKLLETPAPPFPDTTSVSPVDETLTAKEIRDSLQRFWLLPSTELSPERQRIQENMVSMWNTDDTVYIEVIAGSEKYLRDFQRLVFNSPRISISRPVGVPPKGIFLTDTTLFAMHVEPNVYPPTIEQIEISIANHGNEEGMAGSDYYLEYYNGTEWISVPQNYNFTALGYPIAAGETRDEFTAQLYPRLAPNPPGRYRVYKTVSTGQGEQLKNYVLVAPFFISDRPEEYAAYTSFMNRLYIPRRSAEFKGGRKALEQFFRTHLNYLDKYKGTGTTVRLFYSFTIDSAGRLENPQCRPENILDPQGTSDTYDEFKEEALRVLRLMPPWEPAVSRIHGPQPFHTGLFFIFEEADSRLE